MKSILVQGGKVFICEEIVTNKKANTETPYYFSVESLIEAIKKRMEHCVTQLQEAYNKQKVFKVEKDVIEYEGGWFNISSYEAMKDTLKFLNDIRNNQYIDITPSILNDLTIIQLSQLKKAYVSYYHQWNLGASIIEEYEMFKLQTQTNNNK